MKTREKSVPGRGSSRREGRECSVSSACSGNRTQGGRRGRIWGEVQLARGQGP